MNQKVEIAPQVRREGNTLIIPLLEEVLVVEKRLILKEELHLTLVQTEERKPQTVRLRREEATVEHLDSPERKE
jgi:stress response protein YsnF